MLTTKVKRNKDKFTRVLLSITQTAAKEIVILMFQMHIIIKPCTSPE